MIDDCLYSFFRIVWKKEANRKSKCKTRLILMKKNMREFIGEKKDFTQ